MCDVLSDLDIIMFFSTVSKPTDGNRSWAEAVAYSGAEM